MVWSFENWRCSEFVQDLKDLHAGSYRLRFDPPRILQRDVYNSLETMTNIDQSEMDFLVRTEQKRLEDVIDMVGDLLQCEREGLGPEDCLCLLKELVTYSTDVAENLALFPRILDKAGESKRFRGRKTLRIRYKLPQAIKFVRKAHEVLDEQEENIYYSIEGLFRAELASIGSHLQLNGRPCKGDPWRPVHDLVWPYKR